VGGGVCVWVKWGTGRKIAGFGVETGRISIVISYVYCSSGALQIGLQLIFRKLFAAVGQECGYCAVGVVPAENQQWWVVPGVL